MRKRSITIAIYIDALGWRLASEHGFLRNELPSRGPLAATFGGTGSCVPTILTGAPPREHGHFAPFIYDPVHSPFRRLGWLRFVPAFLAANGRFRRWLSRRLRSQLGMSADLELDNTPFPLLPLMDITGGHNLTQPGSIHGGQTTLFDDLRQAGIPFQVFDSTSDGDNLDAAQQAITDGNLEFTYIALTGLHHCLHTRGTRSSAVAGMLASYEDRIKDLLCVARECYGEVKLALFSGDGMADITGECDLMAQIQALPLQPGKDYFAIYDATMARFWFFNSRAERLISEALFGSLDGQWLSDHTLRQWGCDFPGRRYGQRIFLLRPGVLMNPSFMDRGKRAAMHGYDPWHKDSVAFFACSDAGMGRPAGLANLRDLLGASAGVFHLARRSA
jgi:hypothetical protein